MAVTGSSKEGVTIGQMRSIERREMSASARSEQATLLGVEERSSALGDWPLTGPSDPESVTPSDDELRSLTPSDDQIRAITAGMDE